MRLSAKWIRDYVDLTVDDHRLAEDRGKRSGHGLRDGNRDESSGRDESLRSGTGGGGDL